MEAAEESNGAEGQPRFAGNDVQSHHSQHNSEGGAHEGLPGIACAQPYESAEGQQHYRQHLRGAETKGEEGQGQGGYRKQDGCYHHPNEGRKKGGRQGQPRLSLLSHGVPIEDESHRPWFPGDSEQDRGDNTAEEGAPVNGGQEDDADFGGDEDGQGQ